MPTTLRLVLLTAFLFTASAADAQTPRLEIDLLQLPNDTRPGPVTEIGGKLYFKTGNPRRLRAYDPATGVTETVSNTDVRSLGGRIDEVVAFGDKLHFIGQGGLVRFDTASGVTDTLSTTQVPAGIPFRLGSDLYVLAETARASNDIRLYRIDSAAGTLVEAAKLPGVRTIERLRSFGVVGDRLVIAAAELGNERGLFTFSPSDAALSDVTFASDVSNIVNTSWMEAAGGKLYIRTQTDSAGVSKRNLNRLHVYDPATNVFSLETTFAVEGAARVTVGSTLFFSYLDFVVGGQLYALDTAADTVGLVYDVEPGRFGSVQGAAELGGVVYLMTQKSTGAELVAYDPATRTVTKPSPVTADGTTFTAFDRTLGGRLDAAGGLVTFSGVGQPNAAGNGRTVGTELFLYDPAADTLGVLDLTPGTRGSFPSNLAAFGDSLFLSADGRIGPNPGLFDRVPNVLVYDPQDREARRLEFPGGTQEGVGSREFTLFDGDIYFVGNIVASSGRVSDELGRYDVAADTAGLAIEVNPGSGRGRPTELTPYAGMLYFVGTTAAAGTELMRYDAAADTVGLVRDLTPGTASSSIRSLIVQDGKLFFVDPILDGVAGLYSYDAAQDVLMRNVTMTRNSQAKLLDGGIYVIGNTEEVQTDHLYRYDAAADTVSRVFERGVGNFPAVLEKIGNDFYVSSFFVERIDGTTGAVTQISPQGATRPQRGLLVDGVLFFDSEAAGTGRELYAYRPGMAEAILIADLNPGDANGVAGSFASIGTQVYFPGDDGVLGTELYSVDAALVLTLDEPVTRATGVSLSIAPNPAHGDAKLTLTALASGHAEATLYDALGREVARLHDGPLAGTLSLTLPTSRLSSGLYFVRVQTPTGVATRALTVVR